MSEDDLDDYTRDAATVLREGAATDGAEAEEAVSQLPRLLRYAVLALRSDVKERVAAEIAELDREAMGDAAAWSEHVSDAGWQALADRLDLAAVRLDQPVLRSLSDAVRLTSMTLGDIERCPAAALRVVAALRAAQSEASVKVTVSVEWLSRAERMVIGWSMLTGADRERFTRKSMSVHRYAYALGKATTRNIQRWAEELATTTQETRRRESEKTAEQAAAAAVALVPDGHVLVCPPLDIKASTKTKDACKGHEHAIGRPLPLAPMPDIAAVRATLAFEFPYAASAIDTLLAPLVGRTAVCFPPVVLLGTPGAGKSRLARRLAECLAVGLWRTDGAQADGACFGGTDRRWYSTEPCHPFLAVSRGRIANPIVLVDEIEKAGTRSDYGRLWDAMLAFLEPETARNYPDPCLQVDLDLSHVSLVATANSLMPLPAPLLDRLRVVEVPEPRAADLERLLAPLALDLLAEQQLDARWLEPLTAGEVELLAAKWKGGSVRRLRAYLGVIFRARDRNRRLN